MCKLVLLWPRFHTESPAALSFNGESRGSGRADVLIHRRIICCYHHRPDRFLLSVLNRTFSLSAKEQTRQSLPWSEFHLKGLPIHQEENHNFMHCCVPRVAKALVCCTFPPYNMSPHCMPLSFYNWVSPGLNSSTLLYPRCSAWQALTSNS